jgi:LysR family nitrogen assimilation transcriptional regulator
MDLKDMRCVVAIARSGSFIRAAEVLAMSQPSVSARMRHLEGRLGVALFERLPRGVRLTEEGETFRARAEAILAQVETLHDDMRSAARRTPTGLVSVGLPMSLTALLSVPLLDRCRGDLPEVRVRIVESLSGYITQWVRDGQLSLGVIFGETGPPGLLVEPLMRESLLVAAADAATLAPHLDANGEVPFAGIAAMPLILPGPQHGLRDLVERQARAEGVRLDVAIEIDAFAEIQRLVARGDGFGLLSSAALGHEGSPALATARVTKPDLSRVVSLGRDAARPQGSAVREVARRIEAEMRRLADAGAWNATPLGGARRDNQGRNTT